MVFSWLFRGLHLLGKTVFGPFSWLFRGFFVAFSWLFRGLHLLGKTVFGPFSWFFRGFFVTFSVSSFSWLFRGPRFGQFLRVLALEKSSDCSWPGVSQVLGFI